MGSDTYEKYCLLLTVLSLIGTAAVWVADMVTVALAKLPEE
jgi:hypothetical protein